MFALGFLLAFIAFLGLLAFTSRALPAGLPRVLYVIAVLGAAMAYPNAYKHTSSYSAFNELCSRQDRYQVVKQRPASFIYIDWGHSSDCTRGPAFIAAKGYAGFDCKLASGKTSSLFRYSKKESWNAECGLECFVATPIDRPETNYRSEDRSGFVDGTNAVLTGGYGVTTYDSTRDEEKLVFHDSLLVDDGVMAYAREYTYYPYGRGWAKLLGLASGTAPNKTCQPKTTRTDPRDVYVPKTGA